MKIRKRVPLLEIEAFVAISLFKFLRFLFVKSSFLSDLVLLSSEKIGKAGRSEANCTCPDALNSFLKQTSSEQPVLGQEC